MITSKVSPGTKSPNRLRAKYKVVLVVNIQIVGGIEGMAENQLLEKKGKSKLIS